MKDLFQSTHQIQTFLRSSGIPTAAIGGVAVAVWGEPRLTRDVDIKVLLSREETGKLTSLLAPKYTLLANDPEKELRESGLLFIRETDGVRMDLLLADTPFDKQVIRKAVPLEVEPGISITVCRPEDLILYKMISTRARDREDVRGILIRQKSRLEDTYILDWLRQFEKALDDSTLVKEYQKMKAALR